MTLMAWVEFLLHPINFVRGWFWSRRNFDRHGYPRHDGPIRPPGR